MLSRVLDLLEYNRWATSRLATVTASLADEPFQRDLGGSFPSLGATWLHLLRAEWIWISRWHGNPAGEVPDLESSLAPSTLLGLWQELWSAQRAYTDTLGATDADRPVQIVTRTGIVAVLPFDQCVSHLVNHASYHRGQITHFLRQVGAEPISTDLFLYLLTPRAAE